MAALLYLTLGQERKLIVTECKTLVPFIRLFLIPHLPMPKGLFDQQTKYRLSFFKMQQYSKYMPAFSMLRFFGTDSLNLLYLFNDGGQDYVNGGEDPRSLHKISHRIHRKNIWYGCQFRERTNDILKFDQIISIDYLTLTS